MKLTLRTAAILMAMLSPYGVVADKGQSNGLEDRAIDILEEVGERSLDDALELVGDFWDFAQEIIDPTANTFLSGSPMYLDEEHIAALQRELKKAKEYEFRESAEPFRLHADDGLSLDPGQRANALKKWESWLDTDQREIDRLELDIARLQEMADKWNDLADHALRVEDLLSELVQDPLTSGIFTYFTNYGIWGAYIDQFTLVRPKTQEITDVYRKKAENYRDRIDERRHLHTEQREAYEILRIIHGIERNPVVFEKANPADDGLSAEDPTRGAKNNSFVERLSIYARSSKARATSIVRHLASQARATKRAVDRRLDLADVFGGRTNRRDYASTQPPVAESSPFYGYFEPSASSLPPARQSQPPSLGPTKFEAVEPQ